MDVPDTDGNKAWRDWYRKKHKLEMEKRLLAKEQKEKERRSKEEDQIKKEKLCRETWVAWLQKKKAAEKQEKIKKELQNSSVVKHLKDPLQQQKKVSAWLERKLSYAKRNTLLQQEKVEQEKKQQQEMTLHKEKCEKAFEEWKKQKANFRRPVSCIITNRDNYEYTGCQHPQPWQD